MFPRDASKWVQTCLIVPCLAATLCFGMVGCGGGADDAGTGGSETPAADEDAGSGMDDAGSGTEDPAATTEQPT